MKNFNVHFFFFSIYYIIINGKSLSNILNYNFLTKLKDIKEYENISKEFKEFFKEKIDNNTECLDILSKNNVTKILKYSDINIVFDKLNELECNNSKDNYYLFSYEFSETPFKEKNKNDIYNFYNKSFFSTGICLPKKCQYIIDNNFFNDSENIKNNKTLYNYLSNEFKILNIIQWNKKKIERDSISQIICWIIFIYIIIKITIGIVGKYSLENNRNSETIENLVNKEENKEEKKEEKKNSRTSLFTKEHDLNFKMLEDNSQYKNNAEFILGIFSFIENIKIYSKENSFIFNSNNLEFYNIIRGIIIFLSVYNYQFYTILKFPSSNFSDKSFFNFHFYSIKLSSYSIFINCALDGFIVLFKFMIFYKNELNKKKTNITFRFFLKCIPKVFLFFINFFIFHSLLPNIMFILKNLVIKDNLYINYFKEIRCEKEKQYLFIPIYYEYFFNDIFSNCYKFIYIYKNEFVSFIFFLILFVILFKIHSYQFDLIIFVIIIVNLIISPLFSSSPETYNFYSIYGNTNYLIKTHLFFSIYMFGGFFGLMYFYYLDIISPNRFPLQYKPFQFLDFFVSKIDMLSSCVKITFCLIASFILFLFSINVNLMKLMLGIKEISFKMNFFSKFIYHYEIIFVLFFFFLIFINLLLFEKIRINIPFFNFVERINSTMFSNIDSFIHLFFILIDFQINFNYSDLLFASIGSFILIMFLSGMINMLFELPLKLLINKLIKR